MSEEIFEKIVNIRVEYSGDGAIRAAKDLDAVTKSTPVWQGGAPILPQSVRSAADIAMERANALAVSVDKLKASMQGISNAPPISPKVDPNVTPQVDGLSVALNQMLKNMGRALLIAPVWMVVRGAIQAVTSTVQEGIKYWLDTEEATHNLGATLTGLGEVGTAAVENVVGAMHKLSVESGKSEASLINTFAAVNRILQDTVSSQAAVTEATRLSLVTGVDSAKLAEGMSFLYKLQGDSLKGLTTDTEKFRAISELLFATQAKSPGGIEKLIADLRNFDATMSITDFGIENSIRLMGVFESSGVTSGQSLKLGLMKSLANFDETSKMLGLTLPKTASEVEKFKAILIRLGETKNSSNYEKVITDIFGGAARGGVNIAALSKDLDAVREAFKGAGPTAEESLTMKERLNDVTSGAGHQLDVVGNLKKQWVDLFATGPVRDFNELLAVSAAWAKGTGDDLNKISPILLFIGSAAQGARGNIGAITSEFRKWMDTQANPGDFWERMTAAAKGQLSVQSLVEMKQEVINNKLKLTADLKERELIFLDAQIQKQKLIGDAAEAQKRRDEASLKLKEQVALRTKQEVLDNQKLAQLQVERNAQDFALNGTSTLEQQIQRKIDIVQQNTQIADGEKKIIQLAKLQNDLIDVRLKKRETELNQLRDISLKYDEADNAGKERIERAVEISTLPAFEVAGLFRNGRTGDRQAISENMTIFSDEQIRAIKESGDLFQKFAPYLSSLQSVSTENQFLRPEKKANQINQNITMTTEIEPIQVKVNLDSEQIVDKVRAGVMKAFENGQSELTKKVNDAIRNFNVNS